MNSIEITSRDFLEILNNLDYPTVITKNKDINSEQNFREDRSIQGRYLDGFWKGEPKKINPEHGFAIHFVERKKMVWLGEYKGVKPHPENDRNSLIFDNTQLLLIHDLYNPSDESRQILDILKQPGAVTYSYYQHKLPHTKNSGGPSYKMRQIKHRLQQRDFRMAVFAVHGARCIITGCDVPALLDAAHLPGKRWEEGHNSGSDGIPLRADLHRALDAGLIELDHHHRISYLHPDLQTTYGGYFNNID